MSEHRIELSWKRTTKDFEYETYDRTHEIKFEGGQSLSGSSAPEFVGKAAYANPEEMLAASAASCHMLTFLAICARSKVAVNSYTDQAIAILEKSESGRLIVTKIILKPVIQFESSAPDASALRTLHEKAHRNCFIANSIKCAVEIQ